MVVCVFSSSFVSLDSQIKRIPDLSCTVIYPFERNKTDYSEVIFSYPAAAAKMNQLLFFSLTNVYRNPMNVNTRKFLLRNVFLH
jgi:hypothetical protein